MPALTKREICSSFTFPPADNKEHCNKTSANCFHAIIDTQKKYENPEINIKNWNQLIFKRCVGFSQIISKWRLEIITHWRLYQIKKKSSWRKRRNISKFRNHGERRSNNNYSSCWHSNLKRTTGNNNWKKKANK